MVPSARNCRKSKKKKKLLKMRFVKKNRNLMPLCPSNTDWPWFICLDVLFLLMQNIYLQSRYISFLSCLQTVCVISFTLQRFLFSLPKSFTCHEMLFSLHSKDTLSSVGTFLSQAPVIRYWLLANFDITLAISIWCLTSLIFLIWNLSHGLNLTGVQWCMSFHSVLHRLGSSFKSKQQLDYFFIFR